MNISIKNIVLSGIFIAIIGISSSVRAEKEAFSTWLQNLRTEMVQSGISERTVAVALPDTLAPDERIIRLDRKQPEGGVTFERYKNNVITKSRIREGRQKIVEHKTLLQEVGQSYGVEPRYIVALWGMETSFGGYTGNFETIPALVTLAYEGRRGAFFRKELMKALRIVDQGRAGLHQMKGTWAGAMGQCQFMPTSFDEFAQDYDKDGKSDIWNSKADVFASTAAYLSRSGWKKEEPWGVRVSLPKDFDESMIGIKVKRPVEFWRQHGLKIPDVFSAGQELSVVQTGGKGYKAYIVGDNYRIIMKWNMSTYFATAVGLFADQLKS